MTIQELEKQLNDEIRMKQRQLLWLKQHPCPEGFQIMFCGIGVDFDNITHSQVMTLIQHYPGKWNKSVGSDGITYTLEVDIDGFVVRAWNAEPPPNCRVEEYEDYEPEQITPARLVTRKRVVCS